MEWLHKPSLSLDFHLIELFGETGEALNCVKKLLRAKEGIAGGVTDTGALAEELADVVICCSLVRISDNQSGSLRDIYDEYRFESDLDCLRGAFELMRAVGQVIREATRYGPCTPLGLSAVEGAVVQVARAYDIDLMQAVPAKFNATSTKMNLKTRM
jgi:NTP pyrophosphatase (non-canonical NTP hydrolase)